MSPLRFVGQLRVSKGKLQETLKFFAVPSGEFAGSGAHIPGRPCARATLPLPVKEMRSSRHHRNPALRTRLRPCLLKI
jgi:hypothetical protein